MNPIGQIIPFVRRRLKLFDIKVSAGTGNFLDSASYTWKEVGEEVPKEADFGVQITGDSMEPQYKDKQIIWIHQQITLIMATSVFSASMETHSARSCMMTKTGFSLYH